MKGFYFITDSRLSRNGISSDVRNAVKAGVKVVQYREKNKSSREMFREAKVLRRICKNITFLVNDRIDITLACGADGVHLGQYDLSLPVVRKLLGGKKIIGVTVHNLKEALIAQKQGADYLGVSPIFSTGTKLDAGKPIGIDKLKEISKRVRIPIVALGGINLKNAKKVIKSGADSICAISAVLSKLDVYGEILKFRKAFVDTSGCR
ncbi:MAG: thiamine phosphate synthase [Candidatus Omnitrophica bacterium]|nr:thiamine phosphate synthase [Candidatus Omnitrophota bacterium]